MARTITFSPYLLKSLRTYSGSAFRRDLMAGTMVGIIALPLAMAFAIASGVPPAAGLYTAIVAGFLISALGGSRVQIGGPTGAFVVIIYAAIQEHGIENLALCTLLAGLMLLALGLSGLGKVVKYVPYPVTKGFTSGIALIIISGQVKNFLGMDLENLPGDFPGQWQTYLSHLDKIDFLTAGVGLLALLILIFFPKRWNARVPASLVVLVVVSLLAITLDLPLKTIGAVPQSLPPFLIPEINLHLIGELLPTAFTIAMLGAIESLLSAVVADGMIDDQHDSDTELVAQGIANIASPLFGGIPATGAIARTAANVRNNAASPVSGMIHAVVLLLIILFAAPLVEHVPLVALSAILLLVGYYMGEWHEFRRLGQMPRADALVFLATFILTLATDLTFAVEVGVVLAALLFVQRVSKISDVDLMEGELHPHQGFHPPVVLPPGVQIYRVAGAFFFGTADRLELALRRARQEPKVLILAMDQAITIDGTGLNALANLYERLKKRNRRLILCGVHPRVGRMLRQSKLFERIGAENIFPTLDAALEHIEARPQSSPATVTA